MPTPSAPLRLLFVEDDAAIVQGLQYALMQEGYAVTHAGSLAAARAALPAGFDLLLLDVRLPDGSGFDLLREARRRNPEQPAVFLTACDDEIHTVLGLDLGADDYIAKPFRLQELLSRLRAVLRRRSRAEICALPGGVQVDLRRAEISRGGEPISLTALEYKLLLVFLAHPGQVLGRSQLLGAIWDEGGNFVNDNTLTVYIRRLRAKLETPGGPPLIATVRGLGYRLETGEGGHAAKR